MNSYRYLYTSPRILLGPALFILAGGFLQYIIQRSRVRSSDFEKEIFVFLLLRPSTTTIVMQEKFHMLNDQILMLTSD